MTDLKNEVIANRYQVLALLGKGGMGEVYRVVDQLEGDTELALKMIRSNGPITSDLKLRFKEEFRAMAKLQHPNTLKVFDYGQADECSQYLTMEVVEGQELTDLISGTSLPLEQFYPWLIQLLQALGFIHSRLFAHRDIKAENIRIRPDGTLKLMDFGLMDRLGILSTGKITGTPGYLPPEVVKGGVIDASSDLYSVGCLAYQMLTGRLPFRGSLVDTLKAHVSEPPAPPSSLRPDLPRRLEAIVLKLLEKDQKLRYRSAAEVIADLADLSSLQVARETLDQKKSYLNSSVLVGREAELETLGKALTSIRSGQGSALFVGAPAGVGKSRLVSEFVLQATLNDVPVLRGQCLEGGMAPYEPLAQALRPLISLSIPEELQRFGPALVKLLPELAGRGIEPAPASSGDVEKARLSESVIAWLQSVAARTPLVLFLDDVHWCDPSSLELFNRCIRQVVGHAILCLATLRSDETLASSPVWYTVEEGATELLQLSPFTQEQALELLNAMLNDMVISTEFSDFLYAATAGNAFFLKEVLRYMVEEGLLVLKEGVWHFPSDAAGLQLPTSVEATVVRRLSQLSEVARRLAQVASVIGRNQERSMLLAISGLGEEDFFEGLSQLTERQFLVSEGAHVSFAHDRVREALYADLSEDDRRHFHQRCAEYLEEGYGEQRTAFANELAHHFSRGLDKVKAYEYLHMAGDQARAGAMLAVAIRYWKQAEETLLTLDYPGKAPRLAALWGAMGLAGAYGFPTIGVYALEKLIAFQESLGDVERTHAILWLVARVRRRPTFDRARWKAQAFGITPHLRKRLKGVRGCAPAKPLDWLRSIVTTYGLLCAAYGPFGHPMTGMAKAARAKRLKMFAGSPMDGSMLMAEATCLGPAGHYDEVLRLGPQAARLLDESHLKLNPAFVAAWFAINGSQLTVAYQGIRPDPERLEAGIAAAERYQAHPFKNFFWSRQGVWTAFTGRRAETEQLLDLMGQTCRRINAPTYQWAFYLRAYVLWQSGELEEAGRIVQQALQYPHVQQDAFAEFSLRVLGGYIALDRGQLEEADRALTAMRDRARNQHLMLVLIQALIGIGALETVRGNSAAAREHLLEARELSEAGDARNPLHAAIASRRLGELALKEGDYPQAAQEFEQALAIVTRPEQDNLIEQGLLQRDLGELYLATQRPEEARASFRAAGTIFHGLRNRHLLKPVSLQLEQLQHGLERTIEKGATESSASPRWRQRLQGAADWRQASLEIGMTDFQASEATLLEVAPEATPVASRNASGPCAPLRIPADWVSRALAEVKATTFVELPEEASESQGTQLDVTFLSVLIGPVAVDRQVVGALCLVKQEGTFEPEDVERFDDLIGAVSALWSQTASRQTVRGVTLDEELRRTFQAHSCGSSSDLIKSVMTEWAAQLGLDDLAILIGDEISLSVSRAPQETQPISLDHAVLTEAYGSGKCVLGSGEISAGMPPWVAACPIEGEGSLKGALYCVRRGTETPLSETDVPHIETCAQLLGGAMAALSIK